tara:strand:- start:673 stop:936 length:264 start_codon:yes stop_codon:yes gene_type:complete
VANVTEENQPVNQTVLTGEAMQVLIDNVTQFARAEGVREGKKWAKDSEATRIWQKLKNEEAKYRKESRTDIADILGALRKWIRSENE